jgi:hypothetical protein
MADSEKEVVTVKLATILCPHCGAAVSFPFDAATTVCQRCWTSVDVSDKTGGEESSPDGSSTAGGSK